MSFNLMLQVISVPGASGMLVTCVPYVLLTQFSVKSLHSISDSMKTNCKLNEYQHSLYIIYNIARSIDVVVDVVENRENTTLNMTFSSCFYYDSLYSIKPASRGF